MAYKNKEDQKAAARRHYEANRDKMKERAKKHNLEQRDRIRRLILEHLVKNTCVDCPEADPVALEFDHIDPATKLFAIADAGSKGYSLDKVQTEIAKCEVRCANCHRKKTYRDRGFYGKDIDAHFMR